MLRFNSLLLKSSPSRRSALGEIEHGITPYIRNGTLKPMCHDSYEPLQIWLKQTIFARNQQ